MRGVLCVLFVALAVALPVCAQAADQVALFNARLEYTNPDPLRWHKDEERRDPNKGVLVLKRDAVTGRRGETSQPVVAFIYEKVPGTVRTLDEYVKMARDRTPFTIEDISKSDDRIIYFCNYDRGTLHRLVIAHFLFEGNGIQVIADADDGAYDYVQEDFGRLLASIRLLKTAGE